MPIEPFKIVNQDGSTNKSEYERCVKFLNDYVTGSVYVYPQLTWTNPLEIDMSLEEGANEILSRYLLLDNNKLLTKQAFDNIRKLFFGLLDRYGSTIHTYGRYLEASKDFEDGPGYMYDVLTKDETKVIKHPLSGQVDVYYLADDNHTVLEYNDKSYSSLNSDDDLPTSNIPKFSLNNLPHQSNIDTYPNVYKGNLCGVYSDFQRLSGQYVGSSTLFYYSECNDNLYITGGNSYDDSRTESIYNFNYNMSLSNKQKPARGVTASLISTAQTSIVNSAEVNAYLSPTKVNPDVSYISPVFFTSKNKEDWILDEET